MQGKAIMDGNSVKTGQSGAARENAAGLMQTFRDAAESIMAVKRKEIAEDIRYLARPVGLMIIGSTAGAALFVISPQLQPVLGNATGFVWAKGVSELIAASGNFRQGSALTLLIEKGTELARRTTFGN